MKKILHIAYSGFGGQPTFAINIANYGNNFDSEFIHEILFCGIEKLHVTNKEDCTKNNIAYYFLLKKTGFDILFFWRLFLEIKKISPDVIIAHTNSFHFILLFCRLFLYIKIVTVEHHALSLRNLKFHIHSFLSIFFSNKIVVLTKEAKQYFFSKKTLFQKKVEVIPNGIFHNDTVTKSKSFSKFIIGVACRLVSGKDLITIFKACLLLKKNQIDFELNIAGDGFLKNEFEQFVENNNLQNEVTFLGNLNREEMTEFYNSINLFILSSEGEGFGLVIIEAFSYQIACIGSNVSGINSIIEHQKNGLLFELHNETDLFNKIQMINKNQLLKDAIIKQAKIDFIQKYSIETCYHKYKELIRSL